VSHFNVSLLAFRPQSEINLTRRVWCESMYAYVCYRMMSRGRSKIAAIYRSLRVTPASMSAQNFKYLKRLKCDGTQADTRFCLSAKRTSPFKSAEASVQSNIGSRGVRISGSDAGYTKFRVSEGYWLPTPFASFHFTSPLMHHCVPSRFNWTV
jgi:hypothetical protein